MKNIAAAVGLAFSAQKLVAFGKEAINLASDLQEVQNVVDTVFKNSAQEINNFAESALEAYGLSELSAKKYASTMGAMLNSMQVSDEKMLEMSKGLTALTGDLASFYNLDTDEAFQKIRSGISGETEPLKQLGINMSVANMEAYALSQGLNKSYQKMSQGEQAILRYNYLLSVSANAQGDFSRTGDSWANQTRVLSERFNELKGILGDLLINVLTPAVQILNELVSTALEFAKTLSSALGIEQNSSAESVNQAATSQNNLAESTDKATKAQKAQNKALASFDRLNDISKSSDSEADSSSGGSSSGMALGSYATSSSGSDFDTTFISEKLEEILGLVGIACLAIGVILAFTGANIPLGIALIAIGAASLATAIAIDNRKIVKDVGTGLDAIMAIVSAALLAIGIILVIFCKDPKHIALGIALIVVGAAGLVTTVALNWDAIVGFVKKNFDLILAIVSTSLLVVGAILTLSGANIPLGIALMAAGAVGLVTAVALKWDKLSEKTKKVVTTIGAILGAALFVIGAILVFTSANVPLGLGMMIAGGAAVASAVAFNWNTISTKITSVCNSLKKIFSNFGKDVKNWFVNLINGGIGTFEGFINKIIGGLNWLIAKLNKFKITIPAWVPEIGGKSLGFNISSFKTVSIPRLATGAVIPPRSEFVAVLGDQKKGRNLEAPEGLIRQIVREESTQITYDDIKSAFYMAIVMAKQNGVLDFDVNMDGSKVGQRTAKYVGQELNRSGFVLRTAKG